MIFLLVQNHRLLTTTFSTIAHWLTKSFPIFLWRSACGGCQIRHIDERTCPLLLPIRLAVFLTDQSLVPSFPRQQARGFARVCPPALYRHVFLIRAPGAQCFPFFKA